MGNTCDCDSRINGQNLTTSSTGQCERVGGLSSSFINAAKDFQQCAKDKGCQDVWCVIPEIVISRSRNNQRAHFSIAHTAMQGDPEHQR